MAARMRFQTSTLNTSLFQTDRSAISAAYPAALSPWRWMRPSAALRIDAGGWSPEGSRGTPATANCMFISVCSRMTFSSTGALNRLRITADRY